MPTFIIIIATFLVAGSVHATEWTASSVAESARWRDFEQRVQQDYLRATDPGALNSACKKALALRIENPENDPVDLCIEAALATLDRESSYLSPKAYAGMKAPRPFIGIGVELAPAKPINKGLVIVSPISGGAAERGGIQPGDRVLEIDGKDISDVHIDDAARALRGPVGSHLVLKLRRQGRPEPLELSFIRETIQIPRVRAKQLGAGHAWVRVSYFNQDVVTEFLTRLNGVADASTTGLVIDLRATPGGSFDSIVQVASLFCEPGTLLLKKVNREDTQEILSSDAADSHRWLKSVPLVVLVDRTTGGGAEAFAQILRERRQAKLIGETTFGAALITTVFDLGKTAAVNLATARLESGLGVGWLGTGLQVDVRAQNGPRVEFGAPGDVLIDEARRALTQDRPTGAR